MIRLTCTQCKTTLEMDDAFAGGVCRCQHCGTIQTVPAHLKDSAAPAAPVTAGSGSKKLYQSGNGSAGQAGAARGSGLDDLADVVASSGLSRGSLREQPGAAAGKAAPGRRPGPGPNRVPLLAAAAALILVLIGVIVWLATRGGSGPEGGAGNPSGNPAVGNPTPGNSSGTPAGGAGGPTVGPAPTPVGPHFATVPVTGSKVVFVIDRGGSARSFFDAAKASAFSSVESLGGGHSFAVIFCARPEDDWKDLTFPATGLAAALPGEAEACRRKFEDVQTVGSTDLAPAVKRAAGLKPDAIYLITAKGFNLDAGAVGQIEQAVAGSGARLYPIDLTVGGEARGVLEPAAAKTGGAYYNVAPADLR